jgi:regulator of sirC expression with transglutaminase-like and TPR domain
VSGAETEVPLAEAALCIAWEDQRLPRPGPVLQQLDVLADALRPHIASADAEQNVAAINRLLFQELGLQGNIENYYDPKNSYIDQVLERRLGLPILLSLIYLEVGWRLGLPINGLALPGHFLVRYQQDDQQLVVDPFHAGRRWTDAECRMQIKSVHGTLSREMISHYYAPPSNALILARILRNLKHAYLTVHRYDLALAAIERMLLLDQSDASDIRDRGLVRLRLGQAHGALEDFDRYARLAPEAYDLSEIQLFASALGAEISTSN